MSKKLYLIPTFISAERADVIPAYATDQIRNLRHFFVENEKSARNFLKKLNPEFPVQEYQLFPLNEHTSAKDAEECYDRWKEEDIGLLSQAGCPCVADPGSGIVLLAHQTQREVVPLVGPSSIILALMASGLNGQGFAFQGYLPKEKTERIKKLKALEQISSRENQTQIFMETPYHNESLYKELLENLKPQTLLCLAVDLTGPQERVFTQPVGEWRKSPLPAFHKLPALFLFAASR